MKKTLLQHLSPGRALVGFALTSSLLCADRASAQFLPTGAGPYDYNDTANWTGGTINNNFTTNPAADQTITFGANTTLSSTLSINNTSLFTRRFIGNGTQTLTLGGNVTLASSATNFNKVTLGSAVAGEELNISLGGVSRTFSIGTNRQLELVNVLSGANAITKTGVGILTLSNVANTYTGATNIGTSGQTTGILEVTKLANGGQNSSIGSSSNASSNLVFGGTTAGTLRYIGSGDSTDRRFLIGGVGAIFDASGSGAIVFSNTAAPTYASVGNPRTITLTGSNTDENAIAASIADSGAGATSISKTGTGKWVLSGSTTHTGATTVSAGTLLVNGSTAAGSAVSVASSAVLGGSGVIGGAVTVNGTLAPGSSIESLKTGAVSFESASTLAVELDSSAASGVQSDLLAADGNLSLSGTVNLTLSNIASIPAAFADGTTFSLISYSGVWNNGLFTFGGNTVADGATFTVGLNTWLLDYNATSGGSNFTADYLPGGNFVNVVAVPEPGTVGLLIGGLCALIVLQRKRRKLS